MEWEYKPSLLGLNPFRGQPQVLAGPAIWLGKSAICLRVLHFSFGECDSVSDNFESVSGDFVRFLVTSSGFRDEFDPVSGTANRFRAYD